MRFGPPGEAQPRDRPRIAQPVEHRPRRRACVKPDGPELWRRSRTSTRAAPGVPGWSVAGVVPGAADADAHVEGNVERVGATHLTTDEGLQLLTLTLGDLEHELVVDLQQQA